MDEDEAAVVWQEVLDRVMAGQREALGCPFCGRGVVAVDEQQNGERMRLECRTCRRFIEGRFASN